MSFAPGEMQGRLQKRRTLSNRGGWTCARGPGSPDRWCLIGTSHYNLSLCDPMDCSPPGSSVHWIFQARILEWVAIFFSRGSSQPRDGTQVSYIASRDAFPSESSGKPCQGGCLETAAISHRQLLVQNPDSWTTLYLLNQSPGGDPEIGILNQYLW